ncbi:hypothetical protein HYZ41_03490, partial [archaeon]|nr:hypothetical protein [archaeon]
GPIKSCCFPRIVRSLFPGELAPKDIQINPNDARFIEAQRRFLADELPKLIGDFKQSSPDTNVYLMLGSDDCAVNLDVLQGHPNLYHEIHGKRFRIDDGHEIVGYSFVPITPFGIKDFDKFDLSEVPGTLKEEYGRRKRSNYRLDGIKSVSSPSLGWHEYSFSQSQESDDSIQRDLESETFTARPGNTVYVFHTPPTDTSLDIIQSGEHVGSFAVREFIEKYQPKLTLHGHIHETVDMSGKFVERIGNSTMISSGNHNYDNKVAVVEFDLYNPASAQRKKLPCGKVEKMFNRLPGK